MIRLIVAELRLPSRTIQLSRCSIPLEAAITGQSMCVHSIYSAAYLLSVKTRKFGGYKCTNTISYRTLPAPAHATAFSSRHRSTALPKPTPTSNLYAVSRESRSLRPILQSDGADSVQSEFNDWKGKVRHAAIKTTVIFAPLAFFVPTPSLSFIDPLRNGGCHKTNQMDLP